MKIFVTGANGFVGRAFCRTAAARGHEVLGLCRGPNSMSQLGCQAVTGSIGNPPWDAIESFKPAAVLHLAWITTPGTHRDSPENEILVTQSQAMLSGLARLGVRYIAGTGTCIEYASSPTPLREGHSPIHPTVPYSRAKVALCNWLQHDLSPVGVKCCWFRVFYSYGPGEHPGRLTTLIIRKFAAGQPVALRTPDSVKDYIHVSDLAEAMCVAIEANAAGPINLGSGTGIKISLLAEMIAEIMGVDAGLVTRCDPLVPDSWPVEIADITRMQELGWSPATDLRTGLRSLAESLLCNPE